MVTRIGFYTVMDTIYHNHYNTVIKREANNSFSFLCIIIDVLSYVIHAVVLNEMPAPHNHWKSMREYEDYFN